ncbi:MAG: hypothetical protein U1F06_07990 [Steroidobacteraceae bacterium]
MFPAPGPEGGPTAGFTAPGMNLGALPADASRGNTGVFINGRELPMQDVAGRCNEVPVQRALVGRQRRHRHRGLPAAMGTCSSTGARRAYQRHRGRLHRRRRPDQLLLRPRAAPAMIGE